MIALLRSNITTMLTQANAAIELKGQFQSTNIKTKVDGMYQLLQNKKFAHIPIVCIS